jgi:hypothetical protein
VSETLKVVQAHAEAGRTRVSEHGRQALSDDGIDLATAISGIALARVVEDYPTYVKGPCVLCHQYDDHGEPIHVLWGVTPRTPDVATLITAYRPDPQRWSDDFTSRRTK